MAKIAHHLDRGPRERLEDAVKAFHLKNYGALESEIISLTLSDGVGGINGGDIASSLGVELIAMLLASAMTSPGDATKTADGVINLLRSVLERANAAIVDRAEDDPKLSGMAATVVCALILENFLYVAWAGDSRCYVVGRNGAQQVTHDHSEVQILIDQGLILLESAHRHPLSHIITSSLGRDDDLTVDVSVRRLDPDDIVLLCSDGLTNEVTDHTIESYVQQYRQGLVAFVDLPRVLVQEALDAGTQDNCSVLCCEPIIQCPDPRGSAALTRTAGFSLATSRKFYPIKESVDAR
jgi:protein phosphatase